MKTILVPVDFSDNSKNALDYAIQLAKRFDLHLILVHAFHPSITEAIKDSYKILSHKEIHGTPGEIKDKLKLWQEAVTKSEKLSCETIYINGDLSDEINELIEDNSVDLIVMGTKGATGLKEVFIGSNTARVIENAICPVMAIPANYKFKEYQTIAFASDYHDSDKDSINFLAKLSKPFNSKLEIVHIANDDIKPRHEEDLLNYFIENIKKSVEHKKMDFHLLDEEDDIAEALSSFIKKHNIDLVCISTEERFLSGPLFNRGITKDMTHHIQIPLLAFHAYDNDDLDLF